jgi:hypothetical protein
MQRSQVDMTDNFYKPSHKLCTQGEIWGFHGSEDDDDDDLLGFGAMYTCQ